jgi:pterin-4a-carbinolamine dehydratase
MASQAFISYRRTDSMPIAQALRVQFLQRFGTGSTFMDVNGIEPGTMWRQRIDAALKQAVVVLAVIGPGWLTAADRYGRRRLDQADDWVRTELIAALGAGRPIMPLLVGGLLRLPDQDGLPAELRAIHEFQTFPLRDEHWDADVATLATRLVSAHGFAEIDAPVLKPQPELKVAALTADQLDAELDSMPGWEPVESATPRDYPRTRHELRRVFVFARFQDAMDFMAQAVEPIRNLEHHPRWENQWRTVIVHLSTWDIGNRISRVDVALARELDKLYARFERPR